jgi:hypothetical protein
MKPLFLAAAAALLLFGCASSTKKDSTPDKLGAVSNAVDEGSAGDETKPAPEAVTTPTTDEVRYYVGTYATMSPDGKQPYGPLVPVVGKRTLKKNEGLILEVLDMPKRHFEVALTRTEGNTFTGTDKKKTWTGTIVYSGADWQWNTWTYVIKLTDGSGTLKGKGSLENGKMETDKLFYDPSGTPKARMLESLNVATAAEYEAKLEAIKKLGSAKGTPPATSSMSE